MDTKISIQTLQRLPVYLNLLKGKQDKGIQNISAGAIANELGLGEIQVRKDLASVSGGGKPKIGYIIESLIDDIKFSLGCDNVNDAVLVGAGKLGRALLDYDGFKEYGLNIVAAFDTACGDLSRADGDITVFPADKITDMCSRMKIKIGIITVPSDAAQDTADKLIKGGVQAIWNFAPAHIKAPGGIMIKNENMASSLALLSKHLTQKIYGE